MSQRVDSVLTQKHSFRQSGIAQLAMVIELVYLRVLKVAARLYQPKDRAWIDSAKLYVGTLSQSHSIV